MTTKSQDAFKSALTGGKTIQELLELSSRQLDTIATESARRRITARELPGGMVVANLYPNSTAF